MTEYQDRLHILYVTPERQGAEHAAYPLPSDNRLRITCVHAISPNGIPALPQPPGSISAFLIDAALSCPEDFIGEFRRIHPHIPVLLLTDRDDPRISWYYHWGAADVLLRDSVTTDLLCYAVSGAQRRLEHVLLLEKRTARLTASEQRLRQIIQNQTDCVIVFDSAGMIRFANPAAERLVAASASPSFGRDLLEQVAQEIHTTDLQLPLTNGEMFEAEVRIVRIEWEDHPAFLATLRDITHHKRIERHLRESEERYALAARGANDGLWDWNLLTGRFYMSSRWQEMLGYAEGELSYSIDEWYTRVHPEDLPNLHTAVRESIDGKRIFFAIEHRIRHRDGVYRWVLCRGTAIRSDDGEAQRMAGSLTDITDRKWAEQRLQHDAHHDALTGLPNRTLFLNRLGRLIERSRRHRHYHFAVLFLDFDRFKEINDSLGHLLGDRLLVQLARKLEACVRPGDMVARLGGDEFTVLVDDIGDVSAAVQVATRMLEELKEPVQVHGHAIHVTVSIGIALSTSGYRRPEDVLRDADAAMYRAKEEGRGGFEIFDEGMHDRALASRALESDLRLALTRSEFIVEYLPIISISTGAVSGIEALVRWNHPRLGRLLPAQFLETAEESGLIIQLGQVVLEEALRTVQRIQRDTKCTDACALHVNLSARELTEWELPSRLAHAAHDYPDVTLCLEIPEAVIMNNLESAIDQIRRLRDLNIQVQIDDFGTAYSSLSSLHQLPISTIKIDRSFISRMNSDHDDTEIVRSVLTLARHLNKQVIAEGVETLVQLAALHQAGCEFAQGFLFSPPVTADALEQILRDHFAFDVGLASPDA